MSISSNHLKHAAMLVQSLLGSQFNEVMRSDDRAVQPLGMLLKHLEGFRVGLLGNNYRALGLHDACLSFCDSFNTSACTKNEGVRHHTVRVSQLRCVKYQLMHDRRDTMPSLLAWRMDRQGLTATWLPDADPS